ncbi:MAG: hypothetical protein EOO88_54510, partial [Pedobacter sp.]
MDYQLDPIYALYQTTEKLNGDMTKQGQHILEELDGECSRVLTLMLHSKMDDDATRSMIRRHQYSLTILQNKIHNNLAKPSTATQPKAQQISVVLREFTMQIVALGASIRKHFPSHFDTTHPAG